MARRATTLQQHLVQELHDGDHSTPQWIVVPSLDVIDHLRREMAWTFGVAADVRGMTILDLAQRISAEARRRYARNTLSTQAAVWMARRYLESGRVPAGFFDKVLRVRGFRQTLIRSFEELSMSGLVSGEAIERLLVRHSSHLSRRVRHALELFLGWRQSFEATHDDPARILAGASDLAPQSTARLLRTSALRVYGFADWKPLERRLLQSVSKDAHLRMQVWGTLASFASEEQAASWRQCGFEPRRLPESDAAVVEALSAPGEESEAMEVGRRIVAAAQAGTPFHRMAVQTRTTRSHALLRQTFMRIGIPCESIPGQPLSQIRAGRSLLQFLSLLESGLTPGATVDFLTLAPLRWKDWIGFEEDPVPSAWGRVASDARLGEGFEDWQTKLPRYQEELRRQAERFSSSGETSKRVQRLATNATELLQVAEVLNDSLSKFPERGRWSDFVQLVEKHLLAFFDRSQETLEVETAIRRLGALQIHGHGRATRAAFRDAVRQTLSAVSLPHAQDAHHGALILGTEESLRGMCFDRIILMGLRDGEWPAVVSEDPILSDEDRVRLRQALDEPAALPSRAAHTLQEQAQFENAVSRGRQHVLLSYARLDPTTGATRLPSTFLMQWAQETTGQNIDFAAFEAQAFVERVPLTRREAPASGPIVSEEEYDALAIAALANHDARRYVRQLGNLPRRGLTLDTMRNRRRRFTAYDGMLQAADVRRSLGTSVDARFWSISQVHAWSTCPFRFFMQRMLQVEPLDTDNSRELDALAVGRLVHDILEHFHQRLQDRRIDPVQVPFATLREELQRASQQSFAVLESRGQTGSRLLWQLRKTTLVEDLTQYIRRERQRGEWGAWWKPQAFELPFGPQEERRLEVCGDGLRLQFRGFIDRLDRHAQHEGLLVIDYKSGRKLDARRFPSAGQLVVYLLAATQSNDALLEVSEGRFVYVTRRGDFAVQRMLGSDVRKRKGDFERLVLSVAGGIAQGDFHPEPGDKASHCTFCDYRGLCDSRIGQQAARKSAAGQGERFSSLPDFADLLHDLPETSAGREA